MSQGIWAGVFSGPSSFEWDPPTTWASRGQSEALQPSLYGCFKFSDVQFFCATLIGIIILTIIGYHSACERFIFVPLQGGCPGFGCSLLGQVIFWPEGIRSICIFPPWLPESEGVFSVYVFTISGESQMYFLRYCFIWGYVENRYILLFVLLVRWKEERWRNGR